MKARYKTNKPGECIRFMPTSHTSIHKRTNPRTIKEQFRAAVEADGEHPIKTNDAPGYARIPSEAPVVCDTYKQYLTICGSKGQYF